METAVHNLNNGFTGLWASVLTPLKDDLSIDVDKYVSHAKALLQSGLQGLSIFDLNGEGGAFSAQEKQTVLDALVAGGINPQQILVSVTCGSLSDALSLCLHAHNHKVHGCLMGPPASHGAPSNQGLINAYSYVLSRLPAQGWRFYLHNITETGNNGMPHAVIAELLRLHPGVISGIVDSSKNFSSTTELARAFTAACMVYTDNEADYLSVAALKSTGAIGMMCNILPHPAVKMFNLHSSSHAHLINDLHDKVLGHHPPVAGCKAILSSLHHRPQWLLVRPPMVPIQKDPLAEIAKELKEYAVRHEMKLS